MRSFTLIEVLLIIAILVALIGLTVPLGMNLYNNQQLGSSTQEIVQVLRRAQLKSMSMELDSSFGVHITNDSYTLFRGISWGGREPIYDEVFELPAAITVTDQPKDIIFLKFEGKPVDSTDIILSNNTESQRISVNDLGVVSLVPVSPPYIAQASYRWRNDDGGE